MSGGQIFGIVALAAALIVALLVAIGCLSANAKEGELPQVKKKADGGKLRRRVDLGSKEAAVGTKPATVTVPKVKTEKEEISVPVVGVKDNDDKQRDIGVRWRPPRQLRTGLGHRSRLVYCAFLGRRYPTALYDVIAKRL